MIFNFFIANLLAFAYIFSNEYPSFLINLEIPTYGKIQYYQWAHPLQKTWDLESFLGISVLNKMKTIIPQGSIVIDVGAHIGDSSVLYSLAVGENGKVISFEPSKYAFEVLKKNSELHKNIIPFNYAITEADGIYNFDFSDLNEFNGGLIKTFGVFVNVQGYKLDDFLRNNFSQYLNNIKFIKFDCEGYDHTLIKSVSSFLKEFKPILSCEVYPKLTRDEKREYFRTLKDIGYSLYIDPYKGFFDATHLENYAELDEELFCNIMGADVFCFFNSESK